MNWRRIIIFLLLLLFSLLIWQQDLLDDNQMPYLKQVFFSIVGIVSVVVIYGFIRRIRNRKLLLKVTKESRGTVTERQLVLKLLKLDFPEKDIFHDLYLRKSNGRYSQIDLVLLSTVGVIVFEVKKNSGWIFGKGNQSNWTKVLAYGRDKYQFYNPILQNNRHIQNLKAQLKQPENIPFFSVIVFYGDCDLRNVEFVPHGTYLIKSRRVSDVLHLIVNENASVDYVDRNEVIRVLFEAVRNGDDAEIQRRHIENIQGMLGKSRIFQ